MPAHTKEPPAGGTSPARPAPREPRRRGKRSHQADAPGHSRTASRSRIALLDRWPFRRKLDVLVFVPVLVVAAMFVFLANGQVEQARSAAETAQLVRHSEQVAKLIDDLQAEHRQALLVSLHYEALGPAETMAPDTAAYLEAQQAVTAQADAVRTAFGRGLTAPEAQALSEVEALDSVRSSVEQGPMAADTIDPAYDGAVADLIDGLGINGPVSSADDDSGYSGYSGNAAGTSGAGSEPSADMPDAPDSHTARTGASANLLDALLRADAAHATFEASVFAARTGDPNALIEFTNAVGAFSQYTYQAGRFQRQATREQGVELAGMEHNPYQSVIAQQYAALQVDPTGLVTENPAQVRVSLDKAIRDVPTYRHQAHGRLKITRSMIGQIAARAQQTSDDAWWRAWLLLAAALLAFASWLSFCVLARRSVLRTVRELTGAAQRVAEATGQELARVADDVVEAGPLRLAAVPVPVRDEIGELAEAFNRVQDTATALLERQVLSRRNIAEMFGNVGRRVSNLTARQLALIDAVERSETDPAVLERLYRIDHIAVRLQRNADSLMLLAGLRETGTDAGPVRLSNVVRAALGQIEGYERVTPHADGDVTVAPDVVGDLTLMLAELLENAVTFSPASSRVEVRLRVAAERGQAGGAGRPRGGAGPVRAAVRGSVEGGAVRDPAVVEIVDHGLGLSTARLAEENARLVRRERLDLVPTKVLGLFVVGNLSRRWGIQVELTRTQGGGVTATVTIPPAHLLPTPHVPPPRPRPSREVTRTWDTPPATTDFQMLTPVAQPPHTDPRPTTAAGLPRRLRPQSAPDDGAPTDIPPAGPPAGLPDGFPGDAVPGDAFKSLLNGLPRPARPWGKVRSTPTGDAPGDPTGGDLTRGDLTGGDTARGDPAAAGAIPGARSPRPLRRRVRGATLSATSAPSVLPAQRAPDPQETPGWRSVDPEAVRAELEEFEAAVARAHRDSARESAHTVRHESTQQNSARQRPAHHDTTHYEPAHDEPPCQEPPGHHTIHRTTGSPPRSTPSTSSPSSTSEGVGQ